MPTFATPDPITVVLDVTSGQARIVASDRANTTVQINPGNKARTSHARAAEQFHVDYSDGRLVVKAPESSGLKSIIGTEGSVDVTIELPTGSSLQATTADAEIRAEGLLGECHVQTATGHVQLDRTGTLHAETADGLLTVEHVTGHAAVNVASGNVRIREIDGTAAIDSANGDIWVGEATQDLDVSTADGNITVDRAGANITAHTSNGSIRLGEVTRGQAELLTATGQLEVGIREGSVGWIDVRSKTGTVRNSLASQDDPGKFDEKVKVHGRTRSGDIIISRAPQHSRSSHE
ncbi:DUF4097 family beta strand repeat-containing protein [Streptomyces sp. P9-2B-2]|uniref:DUF4097 family beta strand repeat-containing protein n=1 Tax=Streptomyces sp. P9-2B-2 TaxID=3057114 RepID=UPI0025B2935C|nr:DUF4097 family beta strand repeat-containing protein [Streptomyces sp. P9-2B-2]WJY37086.1 DUF4097 family beta strand repeat-containing protein [Streptomyces sp. P9-2B-2]